LIHSWVALENGLQSYFLAIYKMYEIMCAKIIKMVKHNFLKGQFGGKDIGLQRGKKSYVHNINIHHSIDNIYFHPYYETSSFGQFYLCCSLGDIVIFIHEIHNHPCESL